MEHDIIEVPYSDNLQTHSVITISLPQSPPQTQHQAHAESNPQSQPRIQQENSQQTQLQPLTQSTQQPPPQTDQQHPCDDQVDQAAQNDNDESGNNSSRRSANRFKWTKEKSQVAMNLVKYGCKPKLVSIAVGCSLRTAQKFVETVTPKIEGGTFVNYEIRRRGRKSKDVNQRLEAIREVLSKDSSKTQVEIAADLKVSNTTVCRDLKRIGASLRDNMTTASRKRDEQPKGKNKGSPRVKNESTASPDKI